MPASRPTNRAAPAAVHRASVWLCNEIPPVVQEAMVVPDNPCTIQRDSIKDITVSPRDSAIRFMRNFPVVHPNTFCVLRFRMRSGVWAMERLMKLIEAINRISRVMTKNMMTMFLLPSGRNSNRSVRHGIRCNLLWQNLQGRGSRQRA